MSARLLQIPWREVRKGMVVDLNGAPWEVTKAKLKGKVVKVTVESSRGTFTREVKAKALVTIARKGDGEPKGKTNGLPLRDPEGRQTRWATDREAAKAEGLPPGNPELTKPPHKPHGSPWDVPRGKAERALTDILGATLVGEAEDEDAGYYCPPVDPSTVAAHWMLYHHGEQWRELGEGELMAAHRDEHDAALAGRNELKVNHWHTKARP